MLHFISSRCNRVSWKQHTHITRPLQINLFNQYRKQRTLSYKSAAGLEPISLCSVNLVRIDVFEIATSSTPPITIQNHKIHAHKKTAGYLYASCSIISGGSITGCHGNKRRGINHWVPPGGGMYWRDVIAANGQSPGGTAQYHAQLSLHDFVYNVMLKSDNTNHSAANYIVHIGQLKCQCLMQDCGLND